MRPSRAGARRSISNNALSDFATAPQWDQDGKPDWVDQIDPPTRTLTAPAAAWHFMSWLISPGYALDKIAPAMVNLGDSGTLAQLYAKLTGDSASNAWSKFQTAIQKLPNGVTSDDPFDALAQPTQMAHWRQLAELVGRILPRWSRTRRRPPSGGDRGQYARGNAPVARPHRLQFPPK